MTNLIEQRLGPLLVRVQTPVSAEDDALLQDSVNDWALTSVYGQPLPARTFSEATRRISIWQERSGLMLFGEREARALPHLLRFFGVADDRNYVVGVTASGNPLGDGYLTCLRFARTDADIQTASLAEIVSAFVEAEMTLWGQDIEESLRRHYASLPHDARAPRDPLTEQVMHFVDFPAFDSGDMDLGFGLMIEPGSHHVSHAGAYRIWSRPVHAHK